MKKKMAEEEEILRRLPKTRKSNNNKSFFHLCISQPTSLAKRQLGGNTEVVVVVHGEHLYVLHTATGELIWMKWLHKSQRGYFWASNGQILITSDWNFEVYDQWSGKLLYQFEDLFTPAYAAIVVGDPYIAAIRRRRVNETKNTKTQEEETTSPFEKSNTTTTQLLAEIVLLNRTDGSTVSSWLVSNATSVALWRPWLIQFIGSGNESSLIYFTSNSFLRVHVPSLKPLWNTSVDYIPVGNGRGDPFVYLRTCCMLQSFRLDNGQPVSKRSFGIINQTTMNVSFSSPSSTRTTVATYVYEGINHFWGYDRYTAIGSVYRLVNNKNSSSSASSSFVPPERILNISGYSGESMSDQLYSSLPPNPAPEFDVYGNGVKYGTIVVPNTDGQSLLTKHGEVWSTEAGKYPGVVPASTVITDSELYFTHGKSVVGMQLHQKL